MVSGTYQTQELQMTKGRNLPIYTKHITSETEEELIINIEVRIDKRRTDYKKRINEMIEKQTSPAIKIIKEIEKHAREETREGRGVQLYKEI